MIDANFAWSLRLNSSLEDCVRRKNMYLQFLSFLEAQMLCGEFTGHKGQWRGALVFYLICAWTNVWVNNWNAGALRRHRAHYDVTVLCACVLLDIYKQEMELSTERGQIPGCSVHCASTLGVGLLNQLRSSGNLHRTVIINTTSLPYYILLSYLSGVPKDHAHIEFSTLSAIQMT